MQTQTRLQKRNVDLFALVEWNDIVVAKNILFHHPRHSRHARHSRLFWHPEPHYRFHCSGHRDHSHHSQYHSRHHCQCVQFDYLWKKAWQLDVSHSWAVHLKIGGQWTNYSRPVRRHGCSLTGSTWTSKDVLDARQHPHPAGLVVERVQTIVLHPQNLQN